ncbi:hypothetical protein ACQKWADRAFT_175692 [Trichoderma austrokoningii]
MATNLSLTPEEARDRIAIRQVIDNYARYADRRLLDEQLSLFTNKTNVSIYMRGEGTSPSQVVEEREGLRPIFESLRSYTHSTHMNGQSTIDIGPDGRTASGETYCVLYQLSEKDGHRQMQLLSLRYQDILKKEADDAWRFSERKMYIDWSETRPSSL